jgi:hypothetical protein
MLPMIPPNEGRPIVAGIPHTTIRRKPAPDSVVMRRLDPVVCSLLAKKPDRSA